MSTFWSLWIIVLTVTNLALVLWVLLANRKVAVKDDVDPENQKTGHVYDGIEEYDNPLPRWWFNLFIGTLIFSYIYLVLYP
jgi:cytochrome c oxidase cbb3-type subunit III